MKDPDPSLAIEYSPSAVEVVMVELGKYFWIHPSMVVDPLRHAHEACRKRLLCR
jgi:hypothetical protein